MTAADALTRVINTVLPGTVKPTDADMVDSRPSPDVDTTGQSVSPVAPPLEGSVQAPVPAVLPPLPAVSVDAEPLPGAKTRDSAAPPRTVGMTTYRIGSGEVVRIVRGDDQPRRVVIVCSEIDFTDYQPVLSTRAAQDRTGFTLPINGQVIELLHCPDDIYCYLPPGITPDPTEFANVAVIIEPRLCGCGK